MREADYHAHETVEMVDPDGTTRHIDVEIAPIIQKFWEMGVRTFACCQGGEWNGCSVGYGYIGIESGWEKVFDVIGPGGEHPRPGWTTIHGVHYNCHWGRYMDMDEPGFVVRIFWEHDDGHGAIREMEQRFGIDPLPMLLEGCG